jgi:hypothetical protein
MRSENPVERQKFPQWRFHAGEKKPVMVNSDAESAALGSDWYANIEDAFAATRAKAAVFQAPKAEATEEQDERATLYREAAENFIKVDKRWTTERLREAVRGQKAA